MERLQKIMAAAGVGSRRACEQLISAGRVRVNGNTVTELGTKVDPEEANITVDGKSIDLPQRNVYIKLHKPRGVLSDIGGDTRGRETVADLLPATVGRVFSVGRLDLHSEGLVLLTDDGELANRLTHPRYQHPKIYYVLIEQHPTIPQLEQLRHGVNLPDGYRTAPAQVEVVAQLPSALHLAPGRTAGVWLRVVLNEGKKRQIRYMTAAVGHPTLRLVRWAIGALTLDSLEVRAHQPLTRQELSALQQLGNRPARSPAKPAARRPASPPQSQRKR